MSSRVRVMIYAAAPQESPEAVAQAYHNISEELRGTPGLLRNELLSAINDPSSFVVLSEWDSEEAFFAWESGPDHRQATAPLRPYRDLRSRGSFGIYRVAADYTTV